MSRSETAPRSAQDRARFADALRRGAAPLGIDLGSAEVAALAEHYALMCRWAARTNLTAITDPEAAAERHALDSWLFALRFDPADEAAVWDVGSGAGFPGVVLAVARPRLRITLLEPHRKRASFLRVALAAVGRKAEVVEARLEPTSDFRADVIVSRATIPPLELVPLALPRLRPGGRLLLTSGSGAPAPEALEAAAGGRARLERHLHQLPGGEPRLIDELVLLR